MSGSPNPIYHVHIAGWSTAAELIRLLYDRPGPAMDRKRAKADDLVRLMALR